MDIFGVNGWEFVIIVVLALVLIGPERLPEYAAKLARLVRQLRGMADAAKTELREQMGPEFDDIDWKSYDPRQYDPRRIIREALESDDAADPDESGARAGASRRDETATGAGGPTGPTGPGHRDASWDAPPVDEPAAQWADSAFSPADFADSGPLEAGDAGADAGPEAGRPARHIPAPYDIDAT